MKFKFSIFFFLILGNLIYAQSIKQPDIAISRGHHTHTNRDIPYFALKDSNDNALIVSTTERDSTLTDILITKLDSNLNFIYNKIYSVPTDLSYDIPLDAYIDNLDNLIVVGRSSFRYSNTNGLLFIVAFDSAGNILWEKFFDRLENPKNYDYFHQESIFEKDSGLLHVIYTNFESSGTTTHFYTFDKDGTEVDYFFKGDIFQHENLKINATRYKFIFKNGNYYAILRNQEEVSPYAVSHINLEIVKINKNSVEVHPLESVVTVSDDRYFQDGFFDVDSNGNFYIAYQHNNQNKVNIIFVDSSFVNIVLKKTSTSLDARFLGAYIDSNNELNVLYNSRDLGTTVPYQVNKLKYDSNLNELEHKVNAQTEAQFVKTNSDFSFFVFDSNSNLKLFDTDFNLINSFSGLTDFELVDLFKYTNQSILSVGTVYNKLYPNSDFFSQRDIYVKKHSPTQILNYYYYSGQGTSRIEGYMLGFDKSNNSIIVSEEKLGPDNNDIGGSRAPVKVYITKYDENFNVLWELAFSSYYLSSDSKIVFDDNDNIYINININVDTFELLKINPTGQLVYEKLLPLATYLYFNENNNLNLVTRPLRNQTTYKDDVTVYTYNSETGDFVKKITYPNRVYFGNFKDTQGNSYLYLHSPSDLNTLEDEVIDVYKNGTLLFTRNVFMNTRFHFITAFNINLQGAINFAISSYIQGNRSLNRLTLSNNLQSWPVDNIIYKLKIFQNDKLLTVDKNGNLNIYNNDFSSYSVNNNTGYNQPKILVLGDFVLFNIDYTGELKIFDKQLQLVDSFYIPKWSKLFKDLKDAFVLLGLEGQQIYTYNYFSWRRAVLYKYNLLNSTLSLNDVIFKNKNFSIYPNPSSGLVTLKLPKNERVDFAELYDNIGRKLLMTNKNPFDISNINPDIYYLKVYTKKGKVFTSKLIKK